MMVYSQKMLEKLPEKNGFRLRGLDMTRLETFLDAAFAFAVTMLVISIDHIPANYPELIAALKGIPAFASSFTIMMFFWISHRKWSRYYGMEDNTSIFISLLLIFVLLVYIYPLKLMFSAFFSWVSVGWLPSEFVLKSRSELINLFFVYGIGYSVMAFLMAILYKRSKRAKDILKLNQLELVLTNLEITTWYIMGVTSLISALFALIMPVPIATFAGFVYMSLPFTMTYTGIYYNKKIGSLKKMV